MSNETREQALEHIKRLMDDHHLELRDVAQMASVDTEDSERRSKIVVRVMSYIGGIFVFAGVVAFIALNWESMNGLARIVVSLGSGLSAFLLALFAMGDDRYRGAAHPLFVAAAFLIPLGLVVALDELGFDGDSENAGLFVLGVCTALFLAVFARWREITLFVIGVFFATCFWVLLLETWEVDYEAMFLSVGASYLFLATRLRTSYLALVCPVLFFFGGWAVLYGVWSLVEGSVVEISFLVLACAMVYFGVSVKSRALNFAATLAILAYVAYFTGEYFADSMGWPLALILIGVLMMGLGSVALKIDREYLR